MVEVFKSPLNIQKSAESGITAMSENIAIDANSSVRTTIPFGKTFAAVPYVFYTLVCSDNNFELAHYIVSVTTSEFIICVENQSMTPRSVRITYKVEVSN